jgi:purine catabolism regulator
MTTEAPRPEVDVATTGSLTVRDVLGLECMRGSIVRAGAGGLRRDVLGVNIIEVPDVWRWLRGGELVFSAAYPWREHPSRLGELVRNLAKAGVAAAAFKLGQYLQDLPQDMLTIADELAFPVVQLPADRPYRDVIESVYRILVTSASTAAQEDLRLRFVRFGLDEQSVEKVASALARQSKGTVYIVDRLDDVVLVAPSDGIAWRQQLDDLATDDAVVVSELERSRLHRRAGWVETSAGRALAAALVVGHKALGGMALVEPQREQFLEHEFSHACELVSFLLLKRLALLEGRREAASLFFRSLMADTLSNEEAAERALTLGIHLTRPCMVIVAGVATACDPHAPRQILRTRLERVLKKLPHALGDGPDPHQLTALVEIGETHEDQLLQRVSETVQPTVEAPFAAVPVFVAAGNRRLRLEGVRRSRSEALITYATAERMRIGRVVRFRELGVERVLSQVPATTTTRDYVAATLAAIEHDPELLRTLEIYLQKGGNKVATAAALPMHRSSLIYRLNKMSQLLGVDLNDSERCLELWLALRLRRVLGLAGQLDGP